MSEHKGREREAVQAFVESVDKGQYWKIIPAYPHHGHDSRLLHRKSARRALVVMDEGFGQLASAFHSSEPEHRDVVL